ncbi:type III secretion system protein PrgH [Lactococcus petauri]|uniref:type III secretion system protein PrgH n=1 Tax=Lactococcus petauri TaxID=1940789 RepID=UPI0038524FD1
MDISADLLQQIYDSLQNYNPTINQLTEKVGVAMQLFGMAILAILFIMEIQETSRRLDREEGGMTYEVLAEIVISFVVAFVLIKGASHLIDGIVWFGGWVAKWMGKIMPIGTTLQDIPDPKGNLSWYVRPLVAFFQALAQIVQWLVSAIATMIVFLRAITMYTYKAFAPLIIAFFMSKELKQISIGFIKQFGALVLQGALLIFIIGIMSTSIVSDLSFTMSSKSSWLDNIGIYFAIILKSGLMGYLVISSQSLAKRILGAM